MKIANIILFLQFLLNLIKNTNPFAADFSSVIHEIKKYYRRVNCSVHPSMTPPFIYSACRSRFNRSALVEFDLDNRDSSRLITSKWQNLNWYRAIFVSQVRWVLSHQETTIIQLIKKNNNNVSEAVTRAKRLSAESIRRIICFLINTKSKTWAIQKA